MGTRNLTVVVVDGEYKVAQYGQWDGYPTGQGSVICEFIQNQMDLEKFKTAVRKCTYVNAETLNAMWENDREKYSYLSRDTGGDILNLVQNGTAKELHNEIDFAAESLFCEWAYVLDLDNEVLEVYRGFNKDPLNSSERFFNLSEKAEKTKHKHSSGGYTPVKLYRKFPFAVCSSYAMKQLEKCGYREDSKGNELPELDPKALPDSYFASKESTYIVTRQITNTAQATVEANTPHDRDWETTLF